MTSVLSPAGPAAAWIADASWLLFGGGALIFVFVLTLLALSLRDAPGAARVWCRRGSRLSRVV